MRTQFTECNDVNCLSEFVSANMPKLSKRILA